MTLRLKQLTDEAIRTIAEADRAIRRLVDAVRDIHRVLRDHEKRISDLE